MASVDVIITSYNRSRMVGNAITSVLRQTFADFELYVVDDGSTDDSLQTIHALCDGDDRCHIIASAHCGINGVVKNLGAQHGKSRYLTFVDSDDTIAPTALEEIVHAFQEHPVDIIYTNQLVVDSKGNTKPAVNTSIIYNQYLMLTMRCIKQMTVMKRDLFEHLGGHDPSFIYAADYDFFIRASEVAWVYHLERPLYYYFVDKDHEQISNQKKAEQTAYAYRARRAGYLRRGLTVPAEVERGSKLGEHLS